MKKLLVTIGSILLLSLTSYADTYNISWSEDELAEEYTLNITCVETGFGKIRKFSGNITSYKLECNNDYTYKIYVIPHGKAQTGPSSNVITIMPKKSKPVIKGLKKPKLTISTD